MEHKHKDLLCGLMVAAAAAAVFLPALGTLTLVDRDEPRFAEAARVMRATGDYIVPRFNGEVRYDKPPLVYWMMVGGYGIFGVNELGARIGSAVMGIVSCVLVFIIARSMFGRRAAVISGIITATTLQVIVLSRIATADALLLATILTMFLGFWRIHKGRRDASSYLMLYGGLAAGSLTKGPVAVTVLLVSLAIYAMLRREYPSGAGAISKLKLWWGELRQAARELHIIAGASAALVVVLAWFVPAVVMTGGGFLKEGFFSHVLERAFVRSFEGHKFVPVVFYVIILPISFFPWIMILPESVRRVWKSPGDRGRRAFLIGWAAAPYLIFSFLRTQLPHYVLPAYPAFAIMCGAALESAAGYSFWKHPLGKLGLVLFGLAGAGVAGGLIGLCLNRGLPDIVWSFVPAAAAALILTGWALADFIRGNNRRATAAAAVLMTSMILTLALVGLPALEAVYTYKDLAHDVAAQVPGDLVLCTDAGESSLVFYLGRRLRSARKAEQLAALLEHHGRVICIAKRSLSRAAETLGGRKLGEIRCYNIEKTKWENVTLWEVGSPEREITAPAKFTPTYPRPAQALPGNE